MAEDIAQTYLDALNEAMSIHAKKATEGLAFNRTEKAEIVDVSNKEYGDYVVNNGSTKYHAYSENTNYTLGTKVYITIPNGDYTQQKQILGKVSKQDDKPLEYIAPLEQFSITSNNLIEDEVSRLSSDDELFNSALELEGATVSKNYNSWANNPTEQLLANWNFTNGANGSEYILLYHSKDLQEFEDYNKNFKYLGISADFKTLLTRMGAVRGEYGLDIYITYSFTVNNTSAERQYETIKYRFSSNEMVGSVYNFSTFYNQQAKFLLDVSEARATKIHYVGIYLYQEGNFVDVDSEQIPTHYESQILPCNILMRGLGVWFGEDKIDENAIDQLNIYTNNGLFYDGAQLNDKAITKTINLKWLHRDYENSTKDNVIYKTLKSAKTIETDLDIKLYGKIHWFKSSIHTIAEYRSQKADAIAANDEIYSLIEKYKAGYENYDAWLLELEEQDADIFNLISSPNADEYERGIAKYAALWDKFTKSDTYANQITRDEMRRMIQGLNLERYEDYYYNTSTDSYYITAEGEKAIDRALSRMEKTSSIYEDVDEGLLAEDEEKLAGELWEPLNADVFSVSYLPDRQLATCAVKCIVEYGPHKINRYRDENGQIIVEETEEIDRKSEHYVRIDSNVLNFVNLTAVPDVAGQDLAKGLQITHSEKGSSQDVYPLYDGNVGKLYDSNQTTWDRILEANLISAYTGKSYLNGNEVIIWRVPRKDTMLTLENSFSESREEVVNYAPTELDLQILRNADEEFKTKTQEQMFEDYWYIRYSSMGTKVPVKNTFTYYIKEYLVSTATNNTIQCYLFKNNQYITGSISFTFQQSGSCGTDYTFTLGFGELVDDNWFSHPGVGGPALILNDQYYREIKFALYNGKGELINLTEQQKNEIIKLWVEHNQNGYYSGLTNSYNLSFITKQVDYHNNGTTVSYYTRVAVKATGTLEKCKYITLQASLKTQSGTASTYNQREYKLDNIVYTQYLPIHVRTQDHFAVAGSGIVYYNDQGALSQNTVRYSLVGYDDDMYSTDTKPDFETLQKQVMEIDNQIGDVISAAGLYTSSLISTINLTVDVKTAQLTNYENIINIINTDVSKCAEREAELARTLHENLAKEDISEYMATSYTETFVKQSAGLREARALLAQKRSTIESYQSRADDYARYISSYEGLFSVVVANDDNTIVRAAKELYYYPAFASDRHTLQPPSLLVDGAKRNIAINCVFNGTEVYTMPLLMLQNAYNIPALNRWDGKLLIDEDNNQIMAATIAAGTKDINNRFTGTIMGDVQDASGGKHQGLFGYHQGRQSYGFTVDGKGFIGKSGTGRIEFDGIDGSIQSGNYTITEEGAELRKAGSKFNLTNGDLDMYGFGAEYIYDNAQGKYVLRSGTGDVRNSSHTHLSAKSPYFYIGVPTLGGNTNDVDNNTRKSLLYISNTDYHLQTADYGSNSGLKINLRTGEFDSRGKLTITGADGSKIDFGSGNNHIELGINGGSAYFTANGSLTITGNNQSVIDFGEKFTVSGRGTSRIAGSTLESGGIHQDNGLWGINSDGSAYFKNVSVTDDSTFNLGTQGIGGNGITFGNGFASFSGDIYANNGYFTGTVSAATITGGTITGAAISGGTITGGSISGGSISGSTITGGSISGATISATGFVTCSGLTVGGTSYGMTTTSNVMIGSQGMGQDVSICQSTSTSTESITYVTGGSISGNATAGYSLNLSTSSATFVTGVDDSTTIIHYITPNGVSTRNLRYLGVES